MAASNVTDITKTVRVGSRKSQLALIQTNAVISRLQSFLPSMTFEIVSCATMSLANKQAQLRRQVTMTTTGDNILDTALSKIGEKSLFTKELEIGLLDGGVDFVVHSLKDLPTELPQGLVIGAVCKRDDPRDAVVLRSDQQFKDLSTLAPGSVIGTSSLRRAAQLRRNYPHLQIADVRGNLNTRLRKLDASDSIYSALILAVAGMERMKWNDRISFILPPEQCMYAVGQGAMAVECRASDTEILNLLTVLTDRSTLLQCVAERAFLKKLEGGCSVPVAVYTDIQGGKLTLHGGVFSINGSEAVIDSLSTLLTDDKSDSDSEHDMNAWSSLSYAAIVAASDIASASLLQSAEDLGISLAQKLLDASAAEILSVAKQQTADEIMRQKAASLNAANVSESSTSS